MMIRQLRAAATCLPLLTLVCAVAGCDQADVTNTPLTAPDPWPGDEGDEPDDPGPADQDSDPEDDLPDPPESCAEADCPVPDGPCVFFVDAAAVPGGDGLSWATSLADVQPGIDAAACAAESCGGRCQVWTAGGTYTVFQGTRHDSVRLRPAVDLLGGFAGVEETAEERAPETNLTVLDGGDGEQRVLHVVTGANDAVIDGVVITGGSADGEGDDGCGGGLYSPATSPTVRGCTFQDNRASAACGGAGAYARDAAPMFVGCTFAANETAGEGGALLVSGGEATVAACAFTGNRADGQGGALAAREADVRVSGSSFQDNSALGYGGAVYSEGGELLLSRSSFADGAAEGGGGAAVAEGWATVESCTFLGNDAFWGGGIYDWNSHETTVVNCTFTGNYAEEEGGAIARYDGDSDGTLAVTNCVMWGDGSPEIALGDFTPGAGLASVSHSVVEHGFPGPGNLDEDPLLADPSAGDLSLSDGSPCIDRADDLVAPDTDILGLPRVEIDAVGDDGTLADLGAFEFHPE